jgi:hypothetical protein
MERTIFFEPGSVSLPPLDDLKTYFAVGCSLLVTAVLLAIFRYRRHWFIRPSLLILAAYHLRIQWSSVFFIESAGRQLPAPWQYFLTIHGFALAFLLVALPLYAFADRPLRQISETMKRQILGGRCWSVRLEWVLLASTAVVLGLYFVIIPFSDTGLYTLLTDPLGLRMAREDSLKLLPSATVKYLYTWVNNTLAPLLIVGAAVYLVGKSKPASKIARLGTLAFAFFAMALPGNRAAFAFVPLTFAITYFLVKLRRPRLLTLALCLLVISAIPALVTLRREGGDTSAKTYGEYLERIVAGRLFLTPARTTLLYFYDAQAHGFWGAAGIRPLAILADVPFREAPFEIGQAYSPGASQYTYFNASFVAHYYLLFGGFTIPLSVVGVLLFDLLLLVFLSPRIPVMPFVVLFITKSLLVAEGALTSNAVTGGYILIPLLALLALFLHAERSAMEGGQWMLGVRAGTGALIPPSRPQFRPKEP